MLDDQVTGGGCRKEEGTEMPGATKVEEDVGSCLGAAPCRGEPHKRCYGWAGLGAV